MLSSAQYRKILLLNNQGNSIRNISNLTRHSRNTIRKILDIKSPPLFRSSNKPSKLDDYSIEIKTKLDIGTYTTKQIYIDLVKNGFNGSYSLVRRYSSKLLKEKEKNKHKCVRSKRKQNEQHAKWIFSLSQGKICVADLNNLFAESLDSESIQELFRFIINGSLRYRNRSLSIFANLKQIPKLVIGESLGLHRQAVRSYIKKFKSGGVRELFNFSRKEIKKYEEPKYHDKVFQILHSPPSCYGFNRTSWRMEDLYQTMAKEGCALSKIGIRMIIKKEGYRFVKARKVLTSNDPLYREKLKEITSILSNLKPNKKFFSVDEYGPFAVKLQGGRSLTPQGQIKTIPQWQKNKGSIIITAALELSANQITHFPSPKKNSYEMIKLLEMLVDKYPEEDCLYFSWDAASWHASKQFVAKVKEINEKKYQLGKKESFVRLAPLPTGAQFLNIIESVFSGMARAIIHNSNYSSVNECIGAIDRYFLDRNQYFKKNPKRAGRKIWGEERVDAVFNESNNCKNPKYR